MKLTRLAGTFAAGVTGVQLRPDLDEATVAAIRAAVDEHKVLVFRDQPEISSAEFLGVASLFGAPEEEHPTFASPDGVKGVKIVAYDGTLKKDFWHTDGSTRVDCAWLTFLRGMQIPDYGRDTVFCDMEAVYEELSPAMQSCIGNLTAVHAWGYQDPDAPEVEHPVVRENTRTGRKWLYVNKRFTVGLAGFTEGESKALLDFLFELVHRPEYQFRLHWTPGTIAVWDNEPTQHYLVHDRVFDRVMHRVMVAPGQGR